MKHETALLVPDDDRNNGFEPKEILIRVIKNRNGNDQFRFLYMKGILYPDVNNSQQKPKI